MSQELNFKIERMHRLANSGHVKAFVDVNINNTLVIKGFKVIDGAKGCFVAMPQEQGKDKKWYESIRFLSAESKSDLTERILSAYKQN